MPTSTLDIKPILLKPRKDRSGEDLGLLTKWARDNLSNSFADISENVLGSHPLVIPIEVVTCFLHGHRILRLRENCRVPLDRGMNLNKAIEEFTPLDSLTPKPIKELFEEHLSSQFTRYTICLWLNMPLKITTKAGQAIRSSPIAEDDLVGPETACKDPEGAVKRDDRDRSTTSAHAAITNLDRLVLRLCREKYCLPNDSEVEEALEKFYDAIGLIADNFNGPSEALFGYAFATLLNKFKHGKRTTDFRADDFKNPTAVAELLLNKSGFNVLISFFRDKIPRGELHKLTIVPKTTKANNGASIRGGRPTEDLATELATLFNGFLGLKDKDERLYPEGFVHDGELSIATQLLLETYYTSKFLDSEKDIAHLTRSLLEDIFKPHIKPLKDQLHVRHVSIDTPWDDSDDAPIDKLPDSITPTTPEDDTALIQEAVSLKEAKLCVSSKLYRAVAAFYRDDRYRQTVAQIADAQGISKEAVRKRLYEARLCLKVYYINKGRESLIQQSLIAFASQCVATEEAVRQIATNERLFKDLTKYIFKWRNKHQLPPLETIKTKLNIGHESAKWLIKFLKHHTLKKVLASECSDGEQTILDAVLEDSSLQEEFERIAEKINDDAIDSRTLCKLLPVREVEARILVKKRKIQLTRRKHLRNFRALVRSYQQEHRFPLLGDVAHKLNIDAVSARISVSLYQYIEKRLMERGNTFDADTAGQASFLKPQSGIGGM